MDASTNYCTRNKNNNWNNFDKIEYFSNENNFHGKYLLSSCEYLNEESILNLCKTFGLNINEINIQNLNNNNGINQHLFVIRINNLFLRRKFLEMIKSNNHLSIALFSHRYNNCTVQKQSDGVAKWFRKRWKLIQAC